MDRSVTSRDSYLAVFATVTVAATYGVMFGDGHLIYGLAGKEQIFEHLSAWLFLLASIQVFAAVLLHRRTSRGNYSSNGGGRMRTIAYLGLGLFFFVAFGEELSWGQHYLGFETPALIESVNEQKELNLHNLSFIDSNADGSKRSDLLGKLLNSNRLFDYIMIGLFILLPVGLGVLPPLRPLADRLGAPRLPWVLGIPLVLNWMASLASYRWLVRVEPLHLEGLRHMATSEIRELNYALLCTLGMTTLLFVEIRRAAAKARGSAETVGASNDIEENTPPTADE